MSEALDRLWSFPGCLLIRVHTHRMGVTISGRAVSESTGKKEAKVSRKHAADLIRKLRQATKAALASR